MDELKEFVIKSHKEGYANPKTQIKKVSSNIKKIVLKEGKFLYEDIFYGSNPFGGQEKVCKNKKVVWAMNYYGKCNSKIRQRSVYKFLKLALLKCSDKNPFRGPAKFEEGDWQYISETKGNLKEFIGIERILFKKKEIYIGFYQGGRIK